MGSENGEGQTRARGHMMPPGWLSSAIGSYPSRFRASPKEQNNTWSTPLKSSTHQRLRIRRAGSNSDALDEGFLSAKRSSSSFPESESDRITSAPRGWLTCLKRFSAGVGREGSQRGVSISVGRICFCTSGLLSFFFRSY
jgi:hypothetical protein